MPVMCKCKCGKRVGMHIIMCNKCHVAHMQALRDKATAIVNHGLCPHCGKELVKNNALPGWWQCSGYGVQNGEALGSGSRCLFQCFSTLRGK